MLDKPPLFFPPDDLLADLLNLYFAYFHLYMPLLHEPSFRRSVASGLHIRDHRFGAVLLLVCAVASRYSNDPRIFLEGASEHSCGWRWFVQTQGMPRSVFDSPSLYDLQHCCVRLLSYPLKRCALLFYSYQQNTSQVLRHRNPAGQWSALESATQLRWDCIVVGPKIRV